MEVLSVSPIYDNGTFFLLFLCAFLNFVFFLGNCINDNWDIAIINCFGLILPIIAMIFQSPVSQKIVIESQDISIIEIIEVLPEYASFSVEGSCLTIQVSDEKLDETMACLSEIES